MTRSLFPIIAPMLLTQPLFAQSKENHFEARIRPLLVGKCIKCHSGTNPKAGLRLDSRQGLLQGGRRGPALIPGKARASLLVRAVQGRGLKRMPPGKRLTAREVTDIIEWIGSGAAWPAAKRQKTSAKVGKHWSFQPIRRTRPPDDSSGWSANEVDCFIAARRKAKQLRPNPPASRYVLIRRLYFDLLGLPPTAAEVRQFLLDRRPDAYSRLVSRLLASPRYGERWGRYWLDVARYADTAGDNGDFPIPQMYLYRDYVIDAFNSDKPYDQFVVEQLAGDLLASSARGRRRRELIVATGFIAITRRFGTKAYQYHHLEIEDTIDATGRALLGMTIRCARCHDHKFDPITNEDYYALYGFFASTRYPFAGAEAYRRQQNMVPLELTQTQYDRRVKQADQDLANAAKLLAKRPNDATAKSRLAKAKAFRKSLLYEVAYAVVDAKPTDERVHQQGDPQDLGRVVRRNTLGFLSKRKLAIPAGSSGRLQLARWIVGRENPLAARVMVNRIWQHHFGTGLVATPSNFGTAGATPTHPRLLDWLAAELMRSDWSIKAIHRRIVMSRTYRLSSRPDRANSRRDAANRYYWRYQRRQLDAEAIRDSMLAVSGNLDLARPGPHPFPPMNTWRYSQHHPFQAVYSHDHRSVFLMTQRIQRHPYLAIFDGPDTNQTTGSRTNSIVPQQALYLMNNAFVQRAAKVLAQRLVKANRKDKDRVRSAYEKTLGRSPTRREAERALRYLKLYRDRLLAEQVPDSNIDVETLQSLAKVLLSSNEFLYVD